MKFNDNMSVPLWKIKLLQTKQRKKEEEKRKEREVEEERLRKLPPWKRQAEQPKTVIIIDKNTTPNQVDLSKQPSSYSKSKSSSAKQTAPLVNGTAQKVDSGESRGNEGKAGRDEADSGAGGVSEEHCAPVQDNVFLTLERKKKRKAPPVPKGGSHINVIATNFSVTGDPVKSANSSKKTFPSESTNSSSRKTLPSSSESVKENHIQKSSNLNGPSVLGNQTQSSTKPLPSDDKKSLKEDVPKSKTKDSAPSTVKVGSNANTGSRVTKTENSATSSRTASSGSSAASSSKETSSSQAIKKEDTPRPASITQLHNDTEVKPKGRKKSISELSSLFGGAIISSNVKSNSTNQADISVTVDKAKSQKASIDTKPSTASSVSKQSNSPSSNQKIVSAKGQSVKKDSKKPEESKKIVNNSTTKTESKSLPSATKSPSPLRQKPSSDLPASAIISLTNEGPLKSREGQLVRSASVIDDEEEVTISLESPRSPQVQSRRISKLVESADSGKDASSAGTAGIGNGSPEKRKAPSAPHPGMVNGSNKTETKGANSTSKEATSASVKPSNTYISKVEEKKIEYSQNFRDPNFAQKKEETSKFKESSKKEEIPYPSDFRKPVVAASSSNKSQEPVKPASTKVPTISDSKKEPVVQTVGKKTDQTSSDTASIKSNKTVSEQRKDADKTKESPATLTADGHIPYPDDFRRPKTQQAGNKSKDRKDIVKPSDLIKASESPSVEKKDDNDNVTSGGIFPFKLRKTKKPEASGISVISESKDSSKPKVDNSPKAPSSGLIAVGGSSSAGKKKNVKKFEKVEFIGYNSPTGKASALKAAEGKSTKKGRNVSFSSKEEETFEYMSLEASIIHYDENHQGDEEEDGGKKSPQKAKVENGMKNGTLDNSYDDDDDDGEPSLKGNAPIRSSGGFQNLAAANLSAMDMLLGRGPRPAEPTEPPKTAPPPEPESEPEDMSLKPMDGDLFSSAGQGTAALLF